MKRFLSVLLVLALILSAAPVAHAYDGPAASSNIDEHFYVNAQRWTDPIKSTLAREGSGYIRVECIGSNLVVERYDQNLQYLSGQEIALELPYYGGVFLCDDYNFLVVGQDNMEENDETEVFRIIRYSKDWVRQASASVYGANTTIPFEAGCLRFARSGDILYIRTSHEMYADENGTNHQANVMLSVRISDMTVTDQLTRVLNSGYGYISHSFNQFLLVDGSALLAVDHGDYYPRAVALMKYNSSAGQESFYGKVTLVNALPIGESTGHYNDTGVSVGGFDCSSSHYLIAGNSADQSVASDLMYAHRNIFVTATPKNDFTDEATTVRWLTDYSADDDVRLSPPYLVKTESDRFLLIWTENDVLRYCFLDGQGRLDGTIHTGEGALSDCVPILDGDRVLWYVTDSSEPVFYQINLKGDQPHTHSYTAVVTAPTCTAGGFTTYTCACGDSYVADEVAALGHSEVTDRGYAATCTEDGLTDGKHCGRCGEILAAQEVIPATGHIWDAGKVTREPTETETGIRTFTCTVCGETREETIPVLDHTHSYTAVVTDPTCTAGGHTTYTCACGDSYVADEVAALGHSEVTDRGYAATCTEDGLTDGKHCGRCGEILAAQEVIPATGHIWDAGKVTREPTETETGIRTFTCTVCGETRTENIPALGTEYEIVRLSGKGRVQTAIKAADVLKDMLGVDSFASIIIASGDNFADALTGSYLANVKSAPILLHWGKDTSLNEEYIRKNLSAGGTVYILGGTAAVPESVETSLKDAGHKVVRLSGKSRFETNLKILEEAGVSGQEILISTGWNYADSLSASATGLPILMVNTQSGKLTDEQIAFFKAHADSRFTIIGGTGAVSAALEAAMEAIVGDVDRVYGKTREATSVAVAERYFGVPEYALLAYSRNFPDGLCGGPLAYALGAPLLLVNAGQETAAAGYVRDMMITKGYVLGGTAAISDQVVRVVFDLPADTEITVR